MHRDERMRACSYALLEAYALARSLPVVVRSRNVGTLDAPLWVFDFEDEDSTVVIADLTGPLLLSKTLDWKAALEHAQSGHRTTCEGRGDASACTVCAAASSEVTVKSFTHPEYVEPQPEPEELASV
ncbi:hypothetical protein [Pseudactinotalea terrae]|uniref:hypothetical protein n=1 Tax=Pseudactinotalea terrae TaxID=1743262 RepID=UPI0012E153DE|nr:hypothetical protein [Pseudactinotalea terrae]